MINQSKKLMLTLSFLEMWERFGYYGMRALLTLFLIKYYGFADIKAYSVYSLYAAVCYVVPMIGGVLADKILGLKRLLVVGAIIIVAGHAILSLATNSTQMFYLGLACVAVGTGFFKGNVTSLLGSIYGDKNSRARDDGFRTFYIMANIGATISSIICGFVAQNYGWEYGFGLAGIGMLIGLIVLTASNQLLADIGNPPKKKLTFMQQQSASIIGLVLIMVTTISFSYIEMSLKAISIAGVLILLHFLYVMSKCSPKERLGLIFICILLFFFTLMFALEMQLGSFINVFTDRHIDRQIFGLEIPAASLQALNPLSIIIIGTFANISLKKLGRDTLQVFGLGLALSCLCFVTLYSGCFYFDSSAKINVMFLILAMVFMSLSELMMAPIMQSLVTYMTPTKIRGYMMGLLLLCLSYANLAGVLIAKYMLQIDNNNANSETMNSLVTYQSCFLKISALFLVASIIYVAIYRFLNKIYASYN